MNKQKMVYSISIERKELSLNKTLKGLAKLTRFDEYIYFVIITTLLGVAAAEANFDWRFLVLLPANWLAVGFAFMINDIEDAPDDALSNKKSHRNPVVAGLISPKTARISTFLVAMLSAGLFAVLGFWPFIFGLTSLILGFLYSYRGVRLKTIALFDILSHCLMLAGLQFLTGYFSFENTLTKNWFWPFTFVIAISIYGELYNEIRDIENDRAAQLRHTAITLGDRAAHVLMVISLVIGGFSGAVSLFMINLIPGWVLLLMAVLSAIFVLPQLIKIKQGDTHMAIQGSLQKPLERAAALALIFQYLIPWLDQVLNIGWF